MSFFYVPCNPNALERNLECVCWVAVGSGDRGCSRICTGNGSPFLTLHSRLHCDLPGHVASPTKVPRCPTSRKRCVEDKRYRCFLSLPPGSSPSSWIKCPFICAPVLQLELWGRHTSRECDSYAHSLRSWKKVLCFMSIHRKENIFHR